VLAAGGVVAIGSWSFFVGIRAGYGRPGGLDA